MSALPVIYLIVGPTGSGKTAVSIPIARSMNAEIISADSRQIYRDMDIATAKPDAAERSSVSHHLIDFVSPDEVYDAGRFAQDGKRCVDDILRRGKKVLVVGGSGLYIQSFIDGFFEGAGKDESFRKTFREELARYGAVAMHRRLREIDPESASRIQPNDIKRIERALEVYYQTGQPMSWHHRAQDSTPWCIPVFAGMTMERPVLYKRINERVERMLNNGALEETRALLQKGYSPSSVAMEGLGYREMGAFLRGEISYERMVELFKQRSRNYAKRQLTWFRKDSRIRWFHADRYPDIHQLASAIRNYFEEATNRTI